MINRIEFEPVEFIAGDYQEFVYNILDSNGDKIDLTGATCSMVLFPYGNEENASREYQGTVDTANARFTVTLPSTGNNGTDTLEPGLYIQQIKINYGNNKIYRPGQGKVNIRARGKYN